MYMKWKLFGKCYQSPPPPPPPRFGGADSRTNGRGQGAGEIHVATLSLVCSPKIAVEKGWGISVNVTVTQYTSSVNGISLPTD